MAALELRFILDRGEDGQLSYGLDPSVRSQWTKRKHGNLTNLLRSPIDVFITYDGKRASDIVASRYAVRHLVAAEVSVLVLGGKMVKI